MEPVGQQRRMAKEKVGRSVPLSRFSSMLQTSRLARDGSPDPAHPRRSKHPVDGIVVVQSIRLLTTSYVASVAVRSEAQSVEASSWSLAANRFSPVQSNPVKASQGGSKSVKVISTIIFLQPHDPDPTKSG